MQLIEILEKLSNASGVGGQQQASDVAIELLKKANDNIEISKDKLGNVIGELKSKKENAPTIMLEAHIDEIGFIVTQVDDDGFIKVDFCGRADLRSLAATEVLVYPYNDKNNPLYGVFCSIPPHLTKNDKDKTLPAIDKWGIDVGLATDKAKKTIKPGDRVGFVPNFKKISENIVCGKSMDNRAGVASIIYAMSLLRDRELDFNVIVVFAVQEEIGCRGAKTATYAINPDISIAVDVSFAWTPDANRHECGDLGNGPLIGYSPILDTELVNNINEIAKKNDIQVQSEVMGRQTGTDADSISIIKTGVKTALISIPLRYMHTPVEVVNISDIKQTGKLLVECAKGVKKI